MLANEGVEQKETMMNQIIMELLEHMVLNFERERKEHTKHNKLAKSYLLLLISGKGSHFGDMSDFVLTLIS